VGGTVGPVAAGERGAVFVDVDPDTYCLDAKLIEKAITPKTKAILRVHLGCDLRTWMRILRVALKHNLKVVEDCAHAHGGSGRGRARARWGHGCVQLSVEQIDYFGEVERLLPQS